MSWNVSASFLIDFAVKYPIFSYNKNLSEYIPYRPFPAFNLNVGIYGIMPYISTNLYQNDRQSIFAMGNYYGFSMGWCMKVTENLELGLRVTNFFCILPYVTYRNFPKGILESAGFYFDKSKVSSWPIISIYLSSISLQNIHVGMEAADRYIGLDLATILSTVHKFRKYII